MSDVEQHSAARTEVAPKPKTTRSAEALEAERLRLRAERRTRPCPVCFAPSFNNSGSTHGIYGHGFLADPITLVCSTEVNCPRCQGAGRIALLDQEAAS